METFSVSGYDVDGITAAVSSVPAGQQFNLDLAFDRKLSAAELNEARAFMQEHGVYPSKFSQDSKNVLRITMVKPEGVAMPSLAILIGATALAGLVTWRLTTQETVNELTSKIIPVALIAAGAILGLKLIDKMGANNG